MADDRLDHAIDTMANNIAAYELLRSVRDARLRGPLDQTITKADFDLVVDRIEQIAGGITPTLEAQDAAREFLLKRAGAAAYTGGDLTFTPEVERAVRPGDPIVRGQRLGDVAGGA